MAKIEIELKESDADGEGGEILESLGFKRFDNRYITQVVPGLRQHPGIDADGLDTELSYASHFLKPFVETLLDHGITPIRTQVRENATNMHPLLGSAIKAFLDAAADVIDLKEAGQKGAVKAAVTAEEQKGLKDAAMAAVKKVLNRPEVLRLLNEAFSPEDKFNDGLIEDFASIHSIDLVDGKVQVTLGVGDEKVVVSAKSEVGAAASQADLLLFKSPDFVAKDYDFSAIKKDAKAFQSADLRGANLKDADLKGVNFSDCLLQGAHFEGANLEGANFEFARLDGANMAGANLRKANLKDANLTKANLENVRMQAAMLNNANLRDANLQGAALEGVTWNDADLKGANLEGVQYANFDGAKNAAVKASVSRVKAAISQPNLKSIAAGVAEIKKAADDIGDTVKGPVYPWSQDKERTWVKSRLYTNCEKIISIAQSIKLIPTDQ